ncbi:hypothetical protein [Yersinia phage vB_Yru_GN1]|uniref:Uncharacterized protein n=1 Tax=Yersinia phage vB_Yru_GN1 TaxID=3074381 RepID=A0AA86J458_9CAUD|nr:hypothetical protein [Yersinia phage vB_Yru_GN1]
MDYKIYTIDELNDLGNLIYHPKPGSVSSSLIDYLQSVKDDPSKADTDELIKVIPDLPDSIKTDSGKTNELINDLIDETDPSGDFNQLLQCLLKIIDYYVSYVNYSNTITSLRSLMMENIKPSMEYSKLLSEGTLSPKNLSKLVFVQPIKLNSFSEEYLKAMINSLAQDDFLYPLKNVWLDNIKLYGTTTSSGLIIYYLKLFTEHHKIVVNTYVAAKIVALLCIDNKRKYPDNSAQDSLNDALDGLISDKDLSDLISDGSDLIGIINDTVQNNDLGSLQDPDKDWAEVTDRFDPPNYSLKDLVIVANNDNEKSHNTGVVVDNTFNIIDSSKDTGDELRKITDQVADYEDTLSDIHDQLNNKPENNYGPSGLVPGSTTGSGSSSSPSSSAGNTDGSKGVSDITSGDYTYLDEHVSNNMNSLEDVTSGMTEVIQITNSLSKKVNNDVNSQIENNNQYQSTHTMYTDDLTSINEILQGSLYNNNDYLSGLFDRLQSLEDYITNTIFGDLSFLPDNGWGLNGNTLDRVSSIQAILQALLDLLAALICAIKALICLIIGLINGLFDLAKWLLSGQAFEDAYNALKNALNQLLEESGAKYAYQFISKIVDIDKAMSLEAAQKVYEQLVTEMGKDKADKFMLAFNQVNSECDVKGDQVLFELVIGTFNSLVDELMSLIDQQIQYLLGMISDLMNCNTNLKPDLSFFKIKSPGSLLGFKLSIPDIFPRIPRC